MTHRFLHCFVVTVAVVFAASYATVSEIHAQAPVPAAADEVLALIATSDGHFKAGQKELEQGHVDRRRKPAT